MNARRPKGARTWYPGPRTLAPIRAMLADGYPEAELEDLIDGAAELLRNAAPIGKTGKFRPCHWTPFGLFGEKSGLQWLADVAELRHVQARAEQNAERLEAAKAPPPVVPDPEQPIRTMFARRALRELRKAGLLCDDERPPETAVGDREDR